MTELERLQADVADARDRARRAEGLFLAADAELNALKVRLSQALMDLEDARREIAELKATP